MTRHNISNRTGYWHWFWLLCVLAIAVVIALFAGKYPLTWAELAAAISAPFRADGTESTAYTVVWQLRFPRIVAAILVGAGLAAAGAAYQGMFRNPLVSPDILGVSAGAGLGAVVAIYLGLSLLWVQMLAFVGGLLAVLFVYVIARMVRRHDPVLVLVLAGVAVGSLLGAGISLVKVLADPYSQLSVITFWLLGGLNSINQTEMLWALPWMLAGLVPLLLLRWRINLLSLPDEEAQMLGVPVQRLRVVLIVAATLLTASAISFTGIIGWVGLVIPHVARLLVGPNFSRLLPTSLLLGGIFLLLTDTLARTAAPIELPLGVLTSLVGAPFFLFLLARTSTAEK
ncbi:FecCD family ABC transporter permease [Paenalcaligenes sp. Me52]|uniref:FecCD family ABC transporter permease n=1 Tax=Paenalcaligenes sp. Me52 TaxID=3392038 RepID=UPI003D2DD27A